VVSPAAGGASVTPVGVTIGLTGPFTTTGSAAARAAIAVGDAAVGAIEVNAVEVGAVEVGAVEVDAVEVGAVEVGVATAVDVADRVVPSNVAVL
jgi:hypothetical protein